MKISKVSEVLRLGLIEFRRLRTLDNERVSLRAYSQYLNIPHPTLISWLNGEHYPAYDKLLDIAQKLEAILGDQTYDLLGLDRPDRLLHELRADYDAVPKERRAEMLDMIQDWLKENGFYKSK